MVADVAAPKVAGEGATGELRAVIGQHPAELDPMPASRPGDVVDKPAASRADWSPATSVPMA
jgi:hypothetical protein